MSIFTQLYIDFLAMNPDYSGVQKYCNICGFRFSNFLPFNRIKPRNALCPVCKSLERHRHLYIHLLSLFPFLQGKNILHFAPEAVIKQILQNSGANYYDADINPKVAKYTIDCTNISFDDNFFDYIISIHILEHIPDDMQAMRELFRVLRPGGTAFLCVPVLKTHLEDPAVTDPTEREKMFGQFDHVRYYSLAVFCERLQLAGFNTDRISRSELFRGGIADAHLGNDVFVLAQK